MTGAQHGAWNADRRRVEHRWHDTKSTGGRFKRTAPKFRNWVTPDGSAGPSGSGGFAAARGRYHLYVSLACPWAHRTVVFRKLKGLEDVISMTGSSRSWASRAGSSAPMPAATR